VTNAQKILISSPSRTSRFFSSPCGLREFSEHSSCGSPQSSLTPWQLVELLRQARPDLIQSKLRMDPWKLLVAVILLNKTAASVAIPAFNQILEQWPTASDLGQAAVPDLKRVLRPLGLQQKRTERLIELSNLFIYDPPASSDPRPSRSPRKGSGDKVYPSTPISHLPGAGPYALDSFRIFSPMYPGGGAPTGEADALNRLPLVLLGQISRRAESQVPELRDSEWKKVTPSDKELRKYLIWRWSTQGYIWSPQSGSLTPAACSDIETIIHCGASRRTSY